MNGQLERRRQKETATPPIAYEPGITLDISINISSDHNQPLLLSRHIPLLEIRNAASPMHNYMAARALLLESALASTMPQLADCLRLDGHIDVKYNVVFKDENSTAPFVGAQIAIPADELKININPDAAFRDSLVLLMDHVGRKVTKCELLDKLAKRKSQS